MFNKKITEEQFEKIQFETTEEYQHGQLVMFYVSDLIRIQEYGLKRY